MLTSHIITFNGLRILQQHHFKNTCVEFDDDVFYTCFPLVVGPTLEMWENAGKHDGKIYGPGTFLDLRGVVHLHRRRILVHESGFSLCFATKAIDTQWHYMNVTDHVLQPNTKALVISGGVIFEENGKQKQASMFNLINRRPYELNLVGKAELILIS
jgi:hypothetical protein